MLGRAIGLVRSASARCPRTLALGLGLLLTLGLAVACEAVCWLLVQNKQATTVSAERYARKSALYGSEAIPDADVEVVKERAGREVYRARYCIDALGRRITPVADLTGPTGRDVFGVFFGCSFTFGDGVQGGETLPAQVASLAPRVMPYNYGFSGYGPQHLLARLQAGHLREQIPEQRGFALYTLINDHVYRAIGAMHVVAWQGKNWPFYELEGDELVRHGTFTTGRPWRTALYRLLNKSSTLRYFQPMVPALNEGHYELTARMLTESSVLLREQLGAELVVLIFPRAEKCKRLIPYLEQAGIRVVDYSGLRELPYDERFAGEGHPTPAAYHAIAERLTRELGLQDPKGNGLPH